LVVVGDLSSESALRERALIGETPNLAGRLQALAEPGAIVVAASTRRLLGDLFRLRDLGRHEVKGIAEPIAAWAVDDPEAGIELMRNAIGATEANTELNRRTLYLSHLASAHASLGQREVALDLLNEAIQTAEATRERFFEAELYRLRGEILLTLGRRGEAEASLRRALPIARQQQARWWELRAATSLAKHWRDEGKYLEAYSLVQPVYERFVEGFDTASLKNAKALLAELRNLSDPQSQSR
jgi:tetratricopeptide (TPR) repeat protein